MYTVHMEIEGVHCSVAELVSRPVSLSWSSRLPRLRRISRVFESLSRLADPAVAGKYWSAESDEGGGGPGAKAKSSAALLLALGSSHRTPPPSLGLGVHFIGRDPRSAACAQGRPFDPSRRREHTAPAQDERIRKRIYEMMR